MQITITVPAIECARCGATAAIKPQCIVATAHARSQLAGFSVTDSGGGAWIVQAAERPPGWIAGPSGGTDLSRGLCSRCAEAWAVAADAFMASAPQPAPDLSQEASAPQQQLPVGAGARSQLVNMIGLAPPPARVSAPPIVAAPAMVSPSVQVQQARVTSTASLGPQPVGARSSSPAPSAAAAQPAAGPPMPIPSLPAPVAASGPPQRIVPPARHEEV